MFCKHVFAVSHNNRQIHYCFCYFIPIAIMAMHPTNILGYIILYFLKYVYYFNKFKIILMEKHKKIFKENNNCYFKGLL